MKKKKKTSIQGHNQYIRLVQNLDLAYTCELENK